MAVERIAGGEGIREIAEEIGANKSLVAVWVKNAQRKDSAPAFFEVVPPTGDDLQSSFHSMGALLRPFFQVLQPVGHDPLPSSNS